MDLVIPALEKKSVSQDLREHKLPSQNYQKRESQFLKDELQYLISLVDGTNTLYRTMDPIAAKQGSLKMAAKRFEQMMS
jgi:hypothetical protein